MAPVEPRATPVATAVTAGDATGPGGQAHAGRHAASRRRFVRRALGVLGATLGGIAVLGVADADRGDEARRPLYTERLGDAGPVLVFLPGLGLTTLAWRPVAAPLAARVRAVLVDLLGFGRSPKPWTTYSVARHLAELHRVIAPLAAGGRVTLVGHSIGARLAVAYAAAHPAAVERLVLVSLPYFGGEERAKRFLRQRGGWVWTHMVPFGLACLLGRRLFGWALPLILRDLPRDVVEGLKQMTWRSSTSTMWEGIYRHDLAADVARVPAHVPVSACTATGTRPLPWVACATSRRGTRTAALRSPPARTTSSRSGGRRGCGSRSRRRWA